MKRPEPTLGLRHVALTVKDLGKTEAFYTELMGMSVEWRPDEDNVYLTGGGDNLALHQTDEKEPLGENGALDHIGFFLATPDDVDEWFRFLNQFDVSMVTSPKTHRDGARSFYCLDPEGNQVQLIYHPPVSAFDKERG